MNHAIWKRLFCCLIVSLVFIGSAACISAAAEKKYPSSPINIYGPFAAGGPVDTINRVFAKKLEAYFGHGAVVVPQNKPGGGGSILASYIAKSARPDGYTLANISGHHICVPILLGTGSYSLKDFTIIGQLVVFPSVLVVPADSPWKTFQQFMDYAKTHPVKYGHPGNASTIFLRVENFIKHFDLKMEGIPLKGDSETATAVLGKHVAVGAMSAGTAKGLMAAGKVRVLFSFDKPTSFGLPADTPNLAGVLRGAAYTDIEPGQVLAVNSKTPPTIVRTLEDAWKEIMKDPEFQKTVADLNLGLGYMDGKTFTAKLPANMAVLKEMLQKSGQLK
jgi:tripartite-type tricarboxylate transporter receptor subunit TctC